MATTNDAFDKGLLLPGRQESALSHRSAKSLRSLVTDLRKSIALQIAAAFKSWGQTSAPKKSGRSIGAPSEPAVSPAPRVLVIDDDAGMVEILTISLEEAGYNVQSATNGLDGLRIFRESVWNIVITDRAMPDMNGEQLAREIRASSPGVSLIMVTGLVAAVKSPELFDAVVPKPFGVANLLATVNSLSRRAAA